MSRASSIALAGALLCAGCYSSNVAGDAGEPDGSPDAADDVAAEVRADAGPDVEACDRPICAADFPCREDSHCLNAVTVESCRDIPCSEVCGTTCCTGGSCGAGGTTPCPTGTICLESGSAPSPYGGGWAECFPAPVDGPDAGTSPDVGTGVDAAKGGGQPYADQDLDALDPKESPTREDGDSHPDADVEIVPDADADPADGIDWDAWHVPTEYRSYCR